jgi:formylglycine-generating enzyme required for sulfatase activity
VRNAQAAFLAGGTILAAAVSPGQAGSPRGRAIVVEHPRVEAVVLAGRFTMGLSPQDLADADSACREAMLPSPFGLSVCDEYAVELQNTTAVEADLATFAIDLREVTVGEYRQCAHAGVCGFVPLLGHDDGAPGEALPVNHVNWDEAVQYCAWRGGRLPTEAEWEKAARGDAALRWPWGHTDRPEDFNHGKVPDLALRQLDMVRLKMGAGDVDERFGHGDGSDGAAYLAEAGRFPWGRGPYGTFNQAGNVAEWTQDEWLREGYVDLSAVNPLRATGQTRAHVVRGGSWRQPPWVARANVRDPFNAFYLADRRFSHVGFRCARSL